MSDSPKTELQSPLEDSPEHIMLLGRIAAKWATLDDILAKALGTFIGNPEAGEAIYFSSSSQQLRLDMLKAALPCSALPENVQAECAKHLDNISDLWKRRNTMMHNAATVTEKRPAEFSNWVRRPLRKDAHQFLPLRTSEMQDHIDALSKAAMALMAYTHRDFQKLLLAWHERSQQQDRRETGSENPPDPPQLPQTRRDDLPQSSEE